MLYQNPRDNIYGDVWIHHFKTQNQEEPYSLCKSRWIHNRNVQLSTNWRKSSEEQENRAWNGPMEEYATPVSWSVSKSGPSELGTIVSHNPPIADASVWTPASGIEGHTLRPPKFTPPFQLCLLQLAVSVPREILEDIVSGCCNILRLEMLHSVSYRMLEWIRCHIPCRGCNQQKPKRC